MKQPHVVVLGCGFAGFYAIRALMPYAKRNLIRITAIDRLPSFVFTPLLHEAATGGLNAESICIPFRDCFKYVPAIRFICGEATSLDAAKKECVVNGETIAYDAMILATGAVSNDYGIPGIQENAIPLKTIVDAKRIRSALAQACAVCRANGQPLSIAVIGAGPTGVELVAEVSDFVDQAYGKKKANIILVDAAPKMLNGFPDAVHAEADATLKRLNIKTRFGIGIGRVEAQRIVFTDGTTEDAHLVLWTAGVKPSFPPCAGTAPFCVAGRIVVDECLRVRDADGLFVIGDTAAFMETPQSKPLPMLAQVAVVQAPRAAMNVIEYLQQKPLQSFTYHSKGSLISLGRWHAAGMVGRMFIKGRMAWWIWRTVYLFKFPLLRVRFRIALDWTKGLFIGRDIHAA